MSPDLRALLGALWLAGSLLLILFYLSGAALAQSSSNTYTVQPGDTLGAIATRLGVPLETLAAANGITNVDLIEVGQVLVIPTAAEALQTVAARPGDTLDAVAARWNVPVDQLATLNALAADARLFPGQPVQLPQNATRPPDPRFGAVTRIQAPQQIVQGKTGWLVVESSRPISLTAEWNGLPLALTAHAAPSQTLYTAHVPAPALLGPGSFALDLFYTASSGVTVSRTLPIDVVAGDYFSQAINLPPDKGDLLAPEIVQAELVTVTTAWSQTETPIQWRDAFTRPIAPEFATTSPYGTRRSYNGGPYNTYHAGQDFGAPGGTPVVAPADGIVALAQPLTVRGNAVILDHGRGVFTGYWHLTDIFVQEGQRVAVGEPLGTVGTTGLSTGDHLHWELRIYGIAVDPMQYMDEPLFPTPAELVSSEREQGS